ncbi:MAG: hypothetical protein PHD36_07270, partial [Desulfotomaculaceae bacterium]|nr:hypothetical protein [Desulfotomaculaceae bacterium]
MNFKNAYSMLVIFGLVLGIMLALQFRVIKEIQHDESVQRVTELSAQVDWIKKERDTLLVEIDTLRKNLDRATSGPLIDELKEELEEAKILAG